MSLKLPQMKAKDIAKVLQKLHFSFKRQKGSHMFFEHSDGRTTVIPNHPTEYVDRGLLNKIIKHDLQMSREEFLKYI